MKKRSGAFFVLFAAGLTCSAQNLGKWSFEGGVGPTFPVSAAGDRWNTGVTFDLGGGYRFTSHLTGLLELQYDRFSLSDFALAAAQQPAGFTRFWSISVSPRYDFHVHGNYGAYVIGGYGGYARTTAFTDPSQAQAFCDPYYGYCDTGGAPVISSLTNWKGGFNAGGGGTYSLGDSGIKFFTEVRYNRVLSHFSNEFVTLRFGLSY
jgi:opacity protein-like surface antigen